MAPCNFQVQLHAPCTGSGTASAVPFKMDSWHFALTNLNLNLKTRVVLLAECDGGASGSAFRNWRYNTVTAVISICITTSDCIDIKTPASPIAPREAR